VEKSERNLTVAELLLLDNPRRKKSRRRKSRKMPAALLAHFRKMKNAPKKKKSKAARRRKAALPSGIKHRPVFYGTSTTIGARSPFKKLNPRKKGTTMKRKHSRRRYRHNPPFGGIVKSATSGIKTAAVGALAIAANKFLSTQIARLSGVNTANKQLVELGTALIVLPMAARAVKMPFLAAAANVAAASAIYDAGKKYLPATVTAQLGDYGFPNNIPSVDGGMAGLAATDDEGFIVDPGISMIPGATW
jgi:hypothetical protein